MRLGGEEKARKEKAKPRAKGKRAAGAKEEKEAKVKVKGASSAPADGSCNCRIAKSQGWDSCLDGFSPADRRGIRASLLKSRSVGTGLAERSQPVASKQDAYFNLHELL